MSDEKCKATFELANQETVTACHKPKGHADAHEGWCLGSRCTWPHGCSSEYDMWTEQQARRVPKPEKPTP